jgi:hypothetical protein
MLKNSSPVVFEVAENFFLTNSVSLGKAVRYLIRFDSKTRFPPFVAETLARGN